MNKISDELVCKGCKRKAKNGPICGVCGTVFHPSCVERIKKCCGVNIVLSNPNTPSDVDLLNEPLVASFLSSSLFTDILSKVVRSETEKLRQEVEFLRADVTKLRESQNDLMKLLSKDVFLKSTKKSDAACRMDYDCDKDESSYNSYKKSWICNHQDLIRSEKKVTDEHNVTRKYINNESEVNYKSAVEKPLSSVFDGKNAQSLLKFNHSDKRETLKTNAILGEMPLLDNNSLAITNASIQHEENNGHGWEQPRYLRKESSKKANGKLRFITGKKSNSSLRTIEKKHFYYLGRIDPAMNVDDVENYIHSELNISYAKCTLLRSDEHYKSFKLEICQSESDNILNGDS